MAAVGLWAWIGTPGPLTLLAQTRYCGLASVVYREQGEPPVVNP